METRNPTPLVQPKCPGCANTPPLASNLFLDNLPTHLSKIPTLRPGDPKTVKLIGLREEAKYCHFRGGLVRCWHSRNFCSSELKQDSPLRVNVRSLIWITLPILSFCSMTTR